MKYVQIIVILLILISCQQKQNSSTKLQTSGKPHLINIENPEQGNQVNLNDFLEIKKVIKLETQKGCLLGNIKNIKQLGDKLFVSDVNDNLYEFNSDGKFVTKIGSKGKGKGEYILITDFYFDKDRIKIFDRMSNKILLYDLTGKFISDKVNDVFISKTYQIDKIGNSIIAYNSTGIEPGENNAMFYIISDKANKIDLFNYDFCPQNMRYIPGSNVISSFSDTISLINQLDNTIYHYKDGKLISAFEVKTQFKGIDDNIKNKIRKLKNSDSYYKLLADLKVKGFINSIFETDRHLRISYRGSDSNVRSIFYDKVSKKHKTYMAVSPEDCMPEGYPIRIIDNYLVSCYTYENLIFDSKNGRLIKMRFNKDFHNAVSTFHEIDNPLIIFYAFKPIV